MLRTFADELEKVSKAVAGFDLSDEETREWKRLYGAGKGGSAKDRERFNTYSTQMHSRGVAKRKAKGLPDIVPFGAKKS
jgi:hypothetical protein